MAVVSPPVFMGVSSTALLVAKLYYQSKSVFVNCMELKIRNKNIFLHYSVCHFTKVTQGLAVAVHPCAAGSLHVEGSLCYM